METREDDPSKVEKMNCYFINYKIFVNIVKYKLDHMRKKMEMSERDATARSSFKCSSQSCDKNFTDLEVNELLVPMTGEMICTFCGSLVEEDESAGPQSDSRQALAKFNDQMKILYDKLLMVENIKLDPSLLDPEPVEIGQKNDKKLNGAKGPTEAGGKWSGEATRGIGFRAEEQDIQIDFGKDKSKDKDVPKDVPIWITQSTIEGAEGLQNDPSDAAGFSVNTMADANADDDVPKDDDEITRLLLQHEKRNSASNAATKSLNPNDSDSDNKSDDSDMEDIGMKPVKEDNVEAMSSDDDAEDGIPTVRVGNEEITVTDVNEEIINRMTVEEKERYTQIFQDFYSHMYD
jgi:transcription initiation factor TFIIE subunit alpha